MSVRVFNNTRHDTRLLQDVMTHAARRMGVRGEIIVKVTTAKSHGTSGLMRTGWPYQGYLHGYRGRWKDRAGRLVGRHAGWFEIRVPPPGCTGLRNHAVALAVQVIYVAEHEAAHVADLRDGKLSMLKTVERRNPSGRRLPHDRRPVELSAENRLWDRRSRGKEALHREALLVDRLVEVLLQQDHPG